MQYDYRILQHVSSGAFLNGKPYNAHKTLVIIDFFGAFEKHYNVESNALSKLPSIINLASVYCSKLDTVHE